ncbi:MAG: hypothetical protein ACOX41_10790 [Anaerovoracaceae bacterium]
MEAAIFLPIFVISVLTIGYFIKAAAARDDVLHAALDESRWLASRAYLVKAAPAFGSRLEQRIHDENSAITEVRVRGLRYLTAQHGNKGMISFRVDYRMRVPLPLDHDREIRGSEAVLCRGWIGRTNVGVPMGFAAMMEDDGGGTVWVFPESGRRYHSHDCTFVSNEPTQTVLTEAVKRNYKPCHKCHPESLSNGSLVYCYTSYGEAYHRGGCRAVEKYTITLSRMQAEERGYSPCSKCGGHPEQNRTQ